MMIYGKTDIGRHRSSNQDEFAYSILNERVCFGLVCDGMGGGKTGDRWPALSQPRPFMKFSTITSPQSLLMNRVKAVLVSSGEPGQ